MEVFEALTKAGSDGWIAVLVTVIAVEGDPPSRPGAKIVVVDGQVTAGTLGCSEFDTAGVELARSMGVAATLKRTTVFRHGAEQTLELFAERYDPQAGVIVVGATPVGRYLVELAGRIGRRVVHLTDDPVGALRARPPGRLDAVVVSDHDAPYVDEVLRMSLAGDAAFVGMLGSRRHAPHVVERLRAAGVPGEQLVRLHTPCGLDIGSRTPAEIALSIVAEIVATERGRPGGSLQLDWSG